jgi:hypothetical protein
MENGINCSGFKRGINMSIIQGLTTYVSAPRAIQAAAFFGFVELSFRKGGISVQEIPLKAREQIHLWIDLPQLLAAGVALFYFADSQRGRVLNIGFAGAPLILKTICICSGKTKMTHRVARTADHCLRIAAKWVNTFAAVALANRMFSKKPVCTPVDHLLNIISAVVLVWIGMKDTAHTIEFAISAEKNFFNWTLFSVARY